MDNQALQNSVAQIAETLITTQRNLVTISRSLWAVRISMRELHPDFEPMYLKHFAEPERAFDKMRDDLLTTVGNLLIWLVIFEGNPGDECFF